MPRKWGSRPRAWSKGSVSKPFVAASKKPKLPIKQIAASCGFGQEERLRRAFARQVGTTPVEYRQRF